MNTPRYRSSFALTLGLLALLASTSAASAWTGPTATAPSANTPAPLNVGTVAQVKNGNIGVNGLAVFGNTLLQASSYLNFGATAGSAGYGIRDSAGTLQFKNSGDPAWQSLQTIITTLVGGGSGPWTSGTGLIYYNAGFVGIGLTNPATLLDISAGTAQRTLSLRSSSTDYSIPITMYNTSVACASGGQWGFGVNGSAPSTFSTMPAGAFWIHEDCGGARLVINKSGNVGIGTVDPPYLLTVTGNVSAPAIYATNSTANWSIEGAGPTYGVVGVGTSVGVQGNSSAGWGTEGVGANGVYGSASGSGVGVEGVSAAYIGVEGVNSNGANWGGYFTGGYGVYGANTAGYYGELGNGGYSFYGNGQLYVAGAATASTFLYTSDGRLKTDIIPMTNNLSKVLQLKPVTYLWKDQSRGTGTQIGFIAQDVQKVIPEIVHTDASTSIESIDYVRMTPFLVGSVQELNQKIADQQQKIDTQAAEISQLQAAVKALESK